MSSEEHEQLRVSIWDHGPQSVAQLAEQLQLSIPAVVGLADHAWFSTHDETVEIATDG